MGTRAVSSLVEAELRFGLSRSPTDARNHRLGVEFLARLPVLPWGSAAAEAYVLLRRHLTSQGKSLDAMDLLIAAHAVAVDAVLVTHDAAFRHAGPLLRTEDWATDL